MDITTLKERTCPACDRVFKTIHGRNNHLAQSRKCAWYNKQDFEVSDDSSCGSDMGEMGDPTENDMIENDIFDQEFSQDEVIPHEEDSMPPPTKKQKIDDTTTVHDYHPLAGKIFHIDTSIKDEYAKYGASQYHPFQSETDWEVAKWLVEEDIGKSAGDQLMGINKVQISLIFWC